MMNTIYIIALAALIVFLFLIIDLLFHLEQIISIRQIVGGPFDFYIINQIH